MIKNLFIALFLLTIYSCQIQLQLKLNEKDGYIEINKEKLSLLNIYMLNAENKYEKIKTLDTIQVKEGKFYLKDYISREGIYKFNFYSLDTAASMELRISLNPLKIDDIN